ncbi:adenylate/guanylate cyclase domain-containing protein [Dietzia alimentaria]|uniref:adenylate/guanylate cyclase domain-containing protein n=1 Tax=Dietzia alimentaria TaxID=665550 RepID=UPI00029B145D|nr:adenylate/guanylate cyclase domain-containing protein [Dietzia alimentaria]
MRFDLARLRRPDLGSVLLGSEKQSTRVRTLRVRILLVLTLIGSNVVGVAVSGALILFVLPGPRLLSREFLVPTWVVVPVYVSLATILGAVWVYRVFRRRVRWFRDGREPSDCERVRTLRLPARITVIQALLWLLGAAVVTPAYGTVDAEAVPTVGFTVVFAGMVVCGAAFLFADFSMRPVAALALSAGNAPRARFLGAMTRLQVAWAVGSGVPIAGLIIVSIYALAGRAMTVERLAVIALSLGAASLLAGFLLVTLATGSVLGPVRSVRWAMEDVTAGSLARRVVVYDGTELGELQRGFNTMAAGLQERERLRDLFGRHVGRDVAEAAELHEPELGGRDSRVGVVFVDLIGSTEMAVRSEASEVVGVLNRFFAVVVETVEEYDGVVDSFLGDAALVVFGEPRSMVDPATASVACARVLGERLPVRVPDCRAGIGASFGDVVAGYVGSDDRFEYTVIGDAVNEAARLCELAKGRSSLVLASGIAVGAANEAECERWESVGSEVVRGRDEPTELCVPKPVDHQV